MELKGVKEKKNSEEKVTLAGDWESHVCSANSIEVRDHCFLTGNYRRAAVQTCDIKVKNKSIVIYSCSFPQNHEL